MSVHRQKRRQTTPYEVILKNCRRNLTIHPSVWEPLDSHHLIFNWFLYSSMNRIHNRHRNTEFDELNKSESVSTNAFIAVAAFAIICITFHWFGRHGWIPILDSANLALHEAGHPLIGLFSERAAVYGGTLFQLVFPLVFVWHFHQKGQAPGFAASVIWFGENLFNVARYMADARAQELPLVGGDHDWTEIFGRWDVLHLDGKIAGLTRVIASLLILFAIFWLFRIWQASREAEK
jgi:hypothetical protein